ncbi:hypothetical protein CDAR_228981 [Caerostris darwini]|uniref:Uncharacterized protein n=1 Tax=Caerostris darwini TaxID=1538125 RepID=A0AAV4S611_9ARAC|nr:hypothetical protein CDAR_228981 [Caerostris darwini]
MEQNVTLPGETVLSATKPASIHASLVSMEQFAKLRELSFSEKPYLPFSFPTELFFKLICSRKYGAALLKLRNISTQSSSPQPVRNSSSAPKERSTMEQNVALPGETALSATKPASIHASLVSVEEFAKLREVFLRLQLLPK